MIAARLRGGIRDSDRAEWSLDAIPAAFLPKQQASHREHRCYPHDVCFRTSTLTASHSVRKAVHQRPGRPARRHPPDSPGRWDVCAAPPRARQLGGSQRSASTVRNRSRRAAEAATPPCAYLIAIVSPGLLAPGCWSPSPVLEAPWSPCDLLLPDTRMAAAGCLRWRGHVRANVASRMADPPAMLAQPSRSFPGRRRHDLSLSAVASNHPYCCGLLQLVADRDPYDRRASGSSTAVPSVLAFYNAATTGRLHVIDPGVVQRRHCQDGRVLGRDVLSTARCSHRA